MAGRLQTKGEHRIGIIGSAEGEKSGLKSAVCPVDRGYICKCMGPIHPEITWDKKNDQIRKLPIELFLFYREMVRHIFSGFSMGNILTEVK